MDWKKASMITVLVGFQLNIFSVISIATALIGTMSSGEEACHMIGFTLYMACAGIVSFCSMDILKEKIYHIVAAVLGFLACFLSSVGLMISDDTSNFVYPTSIASVSSGLAAIGGGMLVMVVLNFSEDSPDAENGGPYTNPEVPSAPANNAMQTSENGGEPNLGYN